MRLCWQIRITKFHALTQAAGILNTTTVCAFKTITTQQKYMYLMLQPNTSSKRLKVEIGKMRKLCWNCVIGCHQATPSVLSPTPFTRHIPSVWSYYPQVLHNDHIITSKVNNIHGTKVHATASPLLQMTTITQNGMIPVSSSREFIFDKSCQPDRLNWPCWVQILPCLLAISLL